MDDPLFGHFPLYLSEQYFDCSNSLSSSEDSLASPIDSPSGDLYHSIFCSEGSESPDFNLEMACDGTFLSLANSCPFPKDHFVPNESSQPNLAEMKRELEFANHISRPRRFPRKARFCSGKASPRSKQRGCDNLNRNENRRLEEEPNKYDLRNENRRLQEHLRAVQNENNNLREEVALLKEALRNPRVNDSVSNKSTECLPHRTSYEERLVSTGFILMVMWITCVLISNATPHGVAKRAIGFDNSLSTDQSSHLFDMESSFSGSQLPTEQTVAEPNHHFTTQGSSQDSSPSTSLTEDSDSPLKQGTKRKRSQTSYKAVEKNSRRKIEKADIEPFVGGVPVLPKVPVIDEWNSNTTYLMCPNVLQITPPVGARIVKPEDNSPLISFFIPPDSISTSSMDTPNPQVLQVTCQVVGMNLLPV